MSNPSNEILSGAADLIETKGWCRQAYERNGAFCAVGAIREVADSPRWDAVIEAQDKLADVLRENGFSLMYQDIQEVGKDYYNFALILHWNDEEAGGSEEVVRLLRDAARRA